MKNFKKLNIICGSIFSFILIPCFLFLAGFGLNEKVVKNEQEFVVDSAKFTETINLPQKSEYVLQIKYNCENTDGEIVILNKKRLRLRVGNQSGRVVSRYYHIPKNTVEEGNNLLKIKFYPSNPFRIDIRIKNYLASVAGGNVILTLKDSAFNNKGFLDLLLGGIFFFFFSFSLWLGLIYVGEKFFYLFPSQNIFNTIISFIPSTLLFIIFGINSFQGPYSVIVQPFYLFLLLFIGVVIINVCVNLLSISFLRFIARQPHAVVQEWPTQTRLFGSANPLLITSSLDWIKTCDFSDKCVLFSMFLLILCALCLILGLELRAESIAEKAYFILVTGVIIKVFKWIYSNGKDT